MGTTLTASKLARQLCVLGLAARNRHCLPKGKTDLKVKSGEMLSFVLYPVVRHTKIDPLFCRVSITAKGTLSLYNLQPVPSSNVIHQNWFTIMRHLHGKCGTDRQTDRQTETDRQTDREREREKREKSHLAQ